ncbi:FAD-binding domain-containing protein [Stipitochalara longipes BDJ]|nr:FAD-binding domain-containing protein [Stipitochalara longipes BDJ]
MRILNKYPGVNFAVRSGGHDPNPGHASTHGGVLICLRHMKGATYETNTGLAFVKPGGVWNDVITDLERDDITIVGGRLGVVGVGGYFLQGGMSFLNAQYGLAADNIVGWETIRSDGSIVNVDAEKQPELASAMRGSGSQFGIVTQFKVRTYAIGRVWGGVRFYTLSKGNELRTALHNFVPHSDENLKAAVILTDLYIAKGIVLHAVNYFYDDPLPPETGPFAEFLKIPSLFDSTKSQGYAQLLKANGKGVKEFRGRSSFRWRAIISKYSGFMRLRDQSSITCQPFPKIIGKHSEDRGGNAMGLSATDLDRMILEIQSTWRSSKDDEKNYLMSKELTEWIESKVPLWLSEAGMDLNLYMPKFMNDAAWDQYVMSSYRNHDELEKLQREVDRDGTFRTRFGSHKY